MDITKKYTALKLCETRKETSSFSYDLISTLSHGNYSEITGGNVKIEFDTEEEAIKYAFKEDKYGTWLIIPIIKFDNL